MAASRFLSLNRVSLSPLRPHITKSKTASIRPPTTNLFTFTAPRTATSGDAIAASPHPINGFRILSRPPVELGCCSGSLYPLHSVVAVARLTSRLSLTSQSCRDFSQGTLCRTSPGL